MPAPQVGTASALVGLMQVLGVVSGYTIGAIAAAAHRYELGLVALGILEVITMLSVVIRVREGPPPKSREGRPWRAIAAEAWGTDILRERSFLWLVASRLAILMGGSVLTSLALFYLARTMALSEHDTGIVFIPLVGLVAVGTIIAVVPAARISDRVGRKRVIWASCAVSAAGLAIVAGAPNLPIAFVGALLYGDLGRDVPGGRLGAHDGHHPEGLVGPLHGPLERRDGLGRRAGDRGRRDAHGRRRRTRARRVGTARGAVAGRRPDGHRGAPAATGRRAPARGRRRGRRDPARPAPAAG